MTLSKLWTKRHKQTNSIPKANAAAARYQLWRSCPLRIANRRELDATIRGVVVLKRPELITKDDTIRDAVYRELFLSSLESDWSFNNNAISIDHHSLKLLSKVLGLEFGQAQALEIEIRHVRDIVTTYARFARSEVQIATHGTIAIGSEIYEDYEP